MKLSKFEIVFFPQLNAKKIMSQFIASTQYCTKKNCRTVLLQNSESTNFFKYYKKNYTLYMKTYVGILESVQFGEDAKKEEERRRIKSWFFLKSHLNLISSCVLLTNNYYSY